MQIREVINKDEWEDFLQNCSEKTFLQSWNWGEFNKSLGNKIWRFGIYNGINIIGVCLVCKVSARRGTFLFIPHGPILLQSIALKDKKEILELLLISLSDIAKEEKASFIRISPLLERTRENQNIFIDLGFRESPMHSSAYDATWKLDIYPSLEQILSNMRKTTRYLIKKAEKNPEISIEISNDPKNIKIYQQLNKEVAKRQKFVPFSDNFIEKEFETFNKDGQVLFLFGKYTPQQKYGLWQKIFGSKAQTQEIVAGAMIIFWSRIAFYHQAASLKKYSKFSIPYLLQWYAIKEAKKRGCTTYDFWGFTDPQKFPKHPWAGPTLFKMGFGGYKTEYLKTQDFVISNKYWINYIIEKIRKKIRGL